MAYEHHSPRPTLFVAALLLCGGMAPLTVIAAAQTAPMGQTLSKQDEALRQRVTLSLQQDPYFYDEHVNVSIEKGDVVLRGLVFSDWDLRDAIRIATKAAEGRRVVDNLSIVQGGRR